MKRIRDRLLDLALSEPVQLVLSRACVRAYRNGQDYSLRSVADILNTEPTLDAIRDRVDGLSASFADQYKAAAASDARIAELERTAQAAAERCTKAEAALLATHTDLSALRGTAWATSEIVNAPPQEIYPQDAAVNRVPNMQRAPAKPMDESAQVAPDHLRCKAVAPDGRRCQWPVGHVNPAHRCDAGAKGSVMWSVDDRGPA